MNTALLEKAILACEENPAYDPGDWAGDLTAAVCEAAGYQVAMPPPALVNPESIAVAVGPAGRGTVFAIACRLLGIGASWGGLLLARARQLRDLRAMIAGLTPARRDWLDRADRRWSAVLGGGGDDGPFRVEPVPALCYRFGPGHPDEGHFTELTSETFARGSTLAADF